MTSGSRGCCTDVLPAPCLVESCFPGAQFYYITPAGHLQEGFRRSLSWFRYSFVTICIIVLYTPPRILYSVPMFLKYRGSQEHMNPPGPHSTPQAGCTKAAGGQQINAQAFCGSRTLRTGRPRRAAARAHPAKAAMRRTRPTNCAIPPWNRKSLILPGFRNINFLDAALRLRFDLPVTYPAAVTNTPRPAANGGQQKSAAARQGAAALLGRPPGAHPIGRHFYFACMKQLRFCHR